MLNIPIDGQDHAHTGTLEQVGPVEYTQKKKTPFQKCLIDGTEVTIWLGKGNPIPPSCQMTQQTFSLKAKQNGQYTNFGGFWQPDQIPQAQPPQAPTQAQLPQPKPKQQTNGDRDRSFALSYAKDIQVARISSSQDGDGFSHDYFWSLVKGFETYLTTGQKPQENIPF